MFFWSEYYSMIGNKLGLDKIRPEDVTVFNDLDKMMKIIQPDMTIFYQLLSDLKLDIENDQAIVDHFKQSFYKDLSEEEVGLFCNWIKVYVERCKTSTTNRQEAIKRMNETNPRFILRNYLLHQSIEDLEKGDDQLFKKLQQAMKEPYSDRFDEFFAKRPSWASQKAGCSMLSCSS